MPSSSRPSTTTVRRSLLVERRVQLAVAGLAVVALAGGAYALTRVQPIAPAANGTVASGNPTGDTYTDLFDLGYRPDEGQGNVAIAAVYYYPRIQDSLERFTQPSDHQRELAALLVTKGANQTTLAIYLIADSVVPQTDLDLSQATLTDAQGRRYPFRDWVKLNTFLPQETGQVRTASVLLFDATGEDGTHFPGDDAKELTLTLRGLPAPAERTFTWFLPLLPR